MPDVGELPSEFKFTVAQMCEALTQSAGIPLGKAPLLLGCHRHTVLRYIRDFPEVAEARDEAKAAVRDSAEMQLVRGVNGTGAPLSPTQLTAVIFFLKCNGWNDRAGLGEGDAPPPNAPSEASGLSIAELREMERALARHKPTRPDA